MATQFERFKETLEKMLMLDQADLDFGIYRIMNQKRTDIEKYLNNNLKRQVADAVSNSSTAEVEAAKKEINTLVKTLSDAGVNPEDSPKVKELRAKLAEGGDTESLENEVYSHLTTFFSRYYDGGDFISQRRYKKDVYAIPYEGEEVKLHWANADQYYIKTSEYFRSYRFTLRSGKAVEFTLKEASSELNNNRAQNNMERRFALYEEQPIEVVGDTLHINFRYELYPKTENQKDFIVKAYDTVKDSIPSAFMDVLELKPTDKDKNRTLLQKHLNDYVARNTFDYFIHKDLYGFLTRELDFYIKNEILVIDDIDAKHPKDFVQHLSVIKAIKTVGNKIITFLASLENFQKKLWLKKKFVVQADYCITLDRVPEELYPEICKNNEQREEWVKWFKIDEIKKDGMFGVDYTVPLTVDFLKANPFLVLDTAFFSDELKHRILESMENIDAKCNGLLINSENFQALQLLQGKYRDSIGVVITDPPYNTGGDEFLYKDNYANSSWLCLLEDRLKLVRPLMKNNSWMTININDVELNNLMKLIDGQGWNGVNHISVKMSHLSGMKMSHIDKKIPKIKEQIVTVAKGDDLSINPIYVPCDWDEAFNRYTSWVDFNNSLDDCSKWTKKSLRKAALENSINIKDKEKYDTWKIKNANHIYQRAKNDSVADMPHDGIFYKTTTAQGKTRYVLDAKEVLFASKYLKDVDGELKPVLPKGDIWTDIGINNVHNEGGVQLPNGKKPVKLFERLLNMFSNDSDIVLDMFAGTATIVHAAINTKKNSQYIAIQSGYSYFNNKTLRRSKNIIYSDEWRLDTPVSRKGISHCFKYMRLEQYEDTLNNLVVKSPMLADDNGEFYDGYVLGYLLDTETKDSLFNLEWFRNPWKTKLFITHQNETKEETIDLVETFNYLIGLNVKTIRYPKDGICTVEGVTRTGERTLVIWRNVDEIDNESLNTFFEKQAYPTKDSEFDRIYVNGDNNLENLRSDEELQKVVLIEKEFAKRMFEDC